MQYTKKQQYLIKTTQSLIDYHIDWACYQKNNKALSGCGYDWHLERIQYYFELSGYLKNSILIEPPIPTFGNLDIDELEKDLELAEIKNLHYQNLKIN